MQPGIESSRHAPPPEPEPESEPASPSETNPVALPFGPTPVAPLRGVALVTGHTGFLGGAIVRALLARHPEIRIRGLARSTRPEFARLGLDQRVGDVASPDAVRRAVSGADLVFHVAAKAGVWGDEREYRRVNVDGTRHVVEACRQAGVPILVFTSSPSVVFDGRDIEGADESLPLARPRNQRAAYPRTKAEAERLALAAHGPDLRVVALRPHLIWGPGDNHLAPRLLERARAGRLARVETPGKRVDWTYVDNAALGHVLAAEALQNAILRREHHAAPPGGRPYFLSQGEPRPLWDLVDAILRAGGLPPLNRRIPPAIAHVLAFLAETRHRIARKPGEPFLTRFVVEQFRASHWFDIAAARRDFGYTPVVSTEEGLRRLERALAQHRSHKHQYPRQPDPPATPARANAPATATCPNSESNPNPNPNPNTNDGRAQNPDPRATPAASGRGDPAPTARR